MLWPNTQINNHYRVVRTHFSLTDRHACRGCVRSQVTDKEHNLPIISWWLGSCSMVSCPSLSSSWQLGTVRYVWWAGKHHRHQTAFQKYQQVMTPVNATTTDLSHLAEPSKIQFSVLSVIQLEIVTSSSTVLPLNMWLLRFPWKGRTTRLSRGGKRPVASRMSSQKKWIFSQVIGIG